MLLDVDWKGLDDCYRKKIDRLGVIILPLASLPLVVVVLLDVDWKDCYRKKIDRLVIILPLAPLPFVVFQSPHGHLLQNHPLLLRLFLHLVA